MVVRMRDDGALVHGWETVRCRLAGVLNTAKACIVGSRLLDLSEVGGGASPAGRSRAVSRSLESRQQVEALLARTRPAWIGRACGWGCCQHLLQECLARRL